MKKRTRIAGVFLLAGSIAVGAQTAQAYGDQEEKSVGLLDPNRFSIRHSASFGMGGSSKDNLKSQSMYTTMLQYQFAKPVTVNLNFGFPIHNTFNEDQNLTSDNVSSMEYFQNMPLDMSLTWQPRKNLMMRLSVMRDPGPNLSDFYSPLARRSWDMNQW